MADESPKGIGRRIRLRRKGLGLSQPQLAEILKVPQQTISGWENGKAGRPSRLFEAAKALGTTQEWLLREEGPEVVIPPNLDAQIAATIESLDSKLKPAALEFLRNLGQKETEVA